MKSGREGGKETLEKCRRESLWRKEPELCLGSFIFVSVVSQQKHAIPFHSFSAKFFWYLTLLLLFSSSLCDLCRPSLTLCQTLS